ncbi:hypothetical protein BGW80DRAFT_1249206 [Lactifluus volemus]|nr:hypothetical protein BGW80DRAFT_1249206 [Lactifluus volemus]
MDESETCVGGAGITPTKLISGDGCATTGSQFNRLIDGWCHNWLSGDIPTPPSLSLPSADGPFEAEEGKAECSAVLPAAIDRLPNELLEEIFRFDSLDHISFPPLYGSELWDWHRLVHVCRRWRYIIFNSSRSLELRLFCTYGTPVKKSLDCWPALPIILQYISSQNRSPPPVDEDDVIAALRHPDRICTMHLTVTTSLLEKLTTLAQERFPVLKHLELVGESDEEPILPNEYLIGPFPSLRILRVTRVVFPALHRILPFSKDLVSLLLEDLSYLTPAAFRNIFPGMTNLEELHLFFNSPISRPISESGSNNRANAPPCRAVLPALKFVQFCGYHLRYLPIHPVSFPKKDEMVA